MTFEPGRAPIAIGDHVGPYRVDAVLGTGGMGAVYKAFDTRLNRFVAIKVSAEAFSDRFMSEARAIAALNHPHICTLYDVGPNYLVMEFVHGETLAARIARGPLRGEELLRTALELTEAIDAVHSLGIVHRDLKAANIMLTPAGAKLIDFGIAKMTHAADAETVRALTAVGEVVGTPQYMSPEQLQGLAVDGRSDLWALGVVLYEAATGARPFGGDTGALVFNQILGSTPAEPSSRNPEIPRPIGRLISRLLEREPGLRYQTAADVRTELLRLSGGGDARSVHSSSRSRWIAGAAVVLLAVVLGAGAAAYRRERRIRQAREELLPAAASLIARERAVAAVVRLRDAEPYLAGDPAFVKTLEAATRVTSVHSTPEGATVDVQDYLSPDQPWLRIGVTPLDHVRIPAGYLRWQVTGAGAKITAAPLQRPQTSFDLAKAAEAPAGMVFVEGGVWQNSIAFLGWLGPYELPAFFIDKFEVTNRQYQEFVDGGGYARREYWKQPFVQNGRELPWSDAMKLFRDRTDRPGPSTWEAGHYPQDRADFPVTGVSWYEAAAYAEFAGKKLPVIAQGYKVSPDEADEYILRLSNLSGSPDAVGKSQSLGTYGTYDMVGNAREWYWNAESADLRYALGRQASSYGPEALSAFDRSPLNGFRCVKNLGPISSDAMAARPRLNRDFAKYRPASDDVFRVYRSLYAYDQAPLDVREEASDTTAPDWTMQKVTIAADHGERMRVFVFVPKRTRPPFQTVVFFPSARVNFLESSDRLGDLGFIDYVIQSGRAVAYPVYQGLYERRRQEPVYPGPTVTRNTHVAWAHDVGRTLDYLSTRPDVDRTRFAYLGVSQGAAAGVTFGALEERFKTLVLLDGGFFQHPSPPAGTDQADFAPRVRVPVLMVNGRYDATFPYETAQLPMFRMLGTPAGDKRHVVFETPHDVRLKRDDLVREVLSWLDRYLGPVK